MNLIPNSRRQFLQSSIATVSSTVLSKRNLISGAAVWTIDKRVANATPLLTIGTTILTALFAIWQAKVEHQGRVELAQIEGDLKMRIRQLELEFDYRKFLHSLGGSEVQTQTALQSRRPVNVGFEKNFDAIGTDVNFQSGGISLQRGSGGDVCTPAEAAIFGTISARTRSPIAVASQPSYTSAPRARREELQAKIYDSLSPNERPSISEFTRSVVPIATRSYSRASRPSFSRYGSGGDLEIIAAINAQNLSSPNFFVTKA
jgi:hypothetical protein